MVRRRRPALLAGFLGFLALATAGSAAAEDAGRAEFMLGRKHFLAGEHADALPHLTRAYELSGKRPSAIRALAQCERALGRNDRAIALFREYVGTVPTPADAPSVQQTIDLLEAQLASQPAAVKPRAERAGDEADPFQQNLRQDRPPGDPELDWGVVPAAPAQAKQQESELVSSPVFWIVSGAVVVLGGLAAGFLALRSDPPEPYGGSLGHVLQR